MKEEGMRILEIEIRNNKKLRVFKKTLEGQNMEVAGDTATGKTTAISALWDIIEKNGDALTHGEKKGVIKVTLGNDEGSIVAERTHTKSTSEISLTLFRGKKPLPLSIGDFKKMLSKLAVNPHEIMKLKPTERTKTLAQAAGIDVDELDGEIKEAEDARLQASRDLDACVPGEEPEEAEAVDVYELIAKRDAINAGEQKKKDLLRDLNDLRSRSVELVDEIEEASKALKRLTDERDTLSVRIAKGEAWEKKNPVMDTSDIDEQIESSRDTNEKAAAHKAWSEKTDQRATLKEAHTKAVAAVTELREKKAKLLESANWPIKGLSIEDGDILYNGVLLENLGESEQMLVTAALAAGDIEKYPIRVVRMDGIESMSKADFKKLTTLFNKRGIQVLSTRVSRGDTEPQEIVIVDGEFVDGE